MGKIATERYELAQLTAAGFVRFGYWQLDANSFPHIVGNFPPEPGVYVFVVDTEVRYVGSTLTGLRGRMHRYNRPNNKGSNVIYMRPFIRDALTSGAEVNVFATTMKSPILWEGLQIDSIAGLEQGLIRACQPSWNRRGR
jgi:hypothetical protein